MHDLYIIFRTVIFLILVLVAFRISWFFLKKLLSFILDHIVGVTIFMIVLFVIGMIAKVISMIA